MVEPGLWLDDGVAWGAWLRVALLANRRDHHAVSYPDHIQPVIEADGDRLTMTLDGAVTLGIRAQGGRFSVKPAGIEGFDLLLERAGDRAARAHARLVEENARRSRQDPPFEWFAAWDLAFHCPTLALVDMDFAKDQIELMLCERYLHPNGQVPAYEWAFGDANPPVHAMGALKVFRAERVQRGTGDKGFLQRVFHKLPLNYAWWINRKDADGHNLFEGGFLGLDNISVYDRSQPLPAGYSLKQADATGFLGAARLLQGFHLHVSM